MTLTNLNEINEYVHKIKCDITRVWVIAINNMVSMSELVRVCDDAVPACCELPQWAIQSISDYKSSLFSQIDDRIIDVYVTPTGETLSPLYVKENNIDKSNLILQKVWAKIEEVHYKDGTITRTLQPTNRVYYSYQ